jgi:hypothetical protein
MRITRYDPGTQLTYEVTSVAQAVKATVSLVVEKFVGGGFAGQVYQVKIQDIQGEGAAAGGMDGLRVGGLYAMKILVPPSGFSRLFRNMLYWVGFQGPFQLQVNPAAARAGALWQKFIRRAASARLGDENAVVDIYATFVDHNLGSCGELSEWVEGRTWRLEVDDRMDLLKQARRGKLVEAEIGSPEYRAKRKFMREFVRLLYDMGAYEFARQYEWSTCKSQPNCLKRKGAEGDPGGGLVAVDFRAGLALLPFLPMSPGDFKLIAKGLVRGSLVQFDRGSTRKLDAFVQEQGDAFIDMRRMLDELKEQEDIYRNSVPDITHNHVRLLYRAKLWSTMLDSAVTGWRVRNFIDEQHEARLRRSKLLTLLFFTIGLIPFLGRLLRRVWARADWRSHYASILMSFDYLKRAIRARAIEKIIDWHRKGRISAERAQRFAEEPWRYFCHLPLSALPAGLHRFLTDAEFAREKLHHIFVRPVRLYFNSELRRQWLQEMVSEGRRKHMLSDADAEVILSQITEPYIQKYLISLVVHLMTLPVSEIVMLLVTVIYVLMRPELSWNEAGRIGVGIFAVWQVIPVSPGSLIRGFYVIGLIIKERNFKDYTIAVFLSFFRVIGYLAFPIQMTYRYPVLARFMAAHWATEAVHIVPVFGERGALLEHWVFCLFYNWPLTIRRRMRRRAEIRASMKPRYWHGGLCAVAAAGVLALADYVHLGKAGTLPGLKDIWWLAGAASLACGAAVTLGAGGAALWKRLIAAIVCGTASAMLYTAATAGLGFGEGLIETASLAKACAWRVFVFAIVWPIGAIAAELELPDPDVRRA